MTKPQEPDAPRPAVSSQDQPGTSQEATPGKKVPYPGTPSVDKPGDGPELDASDAPVMPASTTSTYKAGNGKTAVKDGSNATAKTSAAMRARWENTTPKARKKLMIACIAVLVALMVGLLVMLFFAR